MARQHPKCGWQDGAGEFCFALGLPAVCCFPWAATILELLKEKELSLC